MSKTDNNHLLGNTIYWLARNAGPAHPLSCAGCNALCLTCPPGQLPECGTLQDNNALALCGGKKKTLEKLPWTLGKTRNGTNLHRPGEKSQSNTQNYKLLPGPGEPTVKTEKLLQVESVKRA